jgi:hypothetical protein
MHTTTTPAPLPYSPAAILSHIVASEPLVYRDTDAGWAGTFAFEIVLGLLFYDLVAMHIQGNVALVVVTHRGASFVRNQWNDEEIVDACRRLRWAARGSMVTQ